MFCNRPILGDRSGRIIRAVRTVASGMYPLLQVIQRRAKLDHAQHIYSVSSAGMFGATISASSNASQLVRRIQP